jgi:hypothetical protein
VDLHVARMRHANPLAQRRSILCVLSLRWTATRVAHDNVAGSTDEGLFTIERRRESALRHQCRSLIALHDWVSRTVCILDDNFPPKTSKMAPRWMHRDRDRIYGDVFQRRLATMGIAEVVSAPASPWQNPYAERLIGSVRRECLNHVIVLGERHLRRLLSAYLLYYYGARTHPSRRTHPRHDASRPRAGARSRSGIRGSGWTSPSLRTTRSLTFSSDQRVGVHMSTSLDPRPRVPRRSISANRVRHDCSGHVAVCRNGFTTAAHSRCPPDAIWRTTRCLTGVSRGI